MDGFDMDHYKHVMHRVHKWRSTTQTSHPTLDVDITTEEVGAALQAIPNNKAGDHDDIIAEFLKYGGEALVIAVTDLFNDALNAGREPATWKLGTIVSLHKQGDKADPNNYRGITLISIFRKAYSTILRNRLAKAVPLHESQAAFRAGRSCDDHLYTWTRILQAAIKAGKPIHAFFLDLKKAYDSVWKEGLLVKLLDKGADGKLLRSLWDHITGLQSRVRMGADMTEYFDVTLGVGQGDPGSTFLFDVYIDDLLEELHSRPEDTKIPLGDDADTHAADLTFADDVNAFSLLHDGLQGHVHVVDKWLCKWRLDPNVSKSKHMVINPGARELAPDAPGIELRGQRVERVVEYKYLGVYFQQDGGWTRHVKYALSKLKQAYGYWRPLLACSRLPPRVRLQMIQTFVYSPALYASSVWDLTQQMRARFDNVAKAAIRTVLSLHARDITGQAIFGDSGLPPPSEIMDANKLCWKAKTVNAAPCRWISSKLSFPIAGMRKAGRPKCGTDWDKAVIGMQKQLGALDTAQDRAVTPLRRSCRIATARSMHAKQPVAQVSLNTRKAVQKAQWKRRVQINGTEACTLDWGVQCWQGLEGRRAQYLDVLPAHQARIIACARAGTLASFDETWENKSQGLMTTWEKCCHCSEPVQGCQAACKHRLLMCPQACVFAGDHRWQAFVEVAGEANPAASVRKLDVQAMTPEEQGAWLSRILAPAVMTTSVAKSYWTTLARALMPEEEALTAMQIAEVDILEQEPHADLGDGGDCITTTEPHAELGGGRCPIAIDEPHAVPGGGEDFIPTTVELEPAEVERTASEAHTRALEVSSAGMLPHSDIEAIAVDANLAINYIRAPVEPRAATAAARRSGGDDRIAIVKFESAREELAATVERHLSNEENVATVEPQLAEEERFATVEPQLAEEEHFATVEEHAGLGERLALGAIQSAEHWEAFRSTGLNWVQRTRGRFYRAVVAGTALALALATAYLASQLAGDVNVLTKDTAM